MNKNKYFININSKLTNKTLQTYSVKLDIKDSKDKIVDTFLKKYPKYKSDKYTVTTVMDKKVATDDVFGTDLENAIESAINEEYWDDDFEIMNPESYNDKNERFGKMKGRYGEGHIKGEIVTPITDTRKAIEDRINATITDDLKTDTYDIDITLIPTDKSNDEYKVWSIIVKFSYDYYDEDDYDREHRDDYAYGGW